MHLSELFRTPVHVLLTNLIVIIQIILVIHAAKTGRYGWIYIILFFPMIGGGIYFYMEVLPDLQREGFAACCLKFRSSNSRIRACQQLLEDADTVENRCALGEELSAAKRYDEAIAAYQACLTGAFADDPYVLMGLAKVCFFQGDYATAQATLRKVNTSEARELQPRRQLLLARACHALGQTAEASRLYQEAMDCSSGEEACCRYALFLAENGDPVAARELFTGILSRFRRGNARYRRDQREWRKIARKQLGTIEHASPANTQSG